MSKLNPKLQQIIVFLTLLLSTYFGYMFTNFNNVASTIWISTGFAMAFYIFYNKKYVIAIFLGLFLGRMLARAIMSDEEIYVSFFLSVGFTLINFLQIFTIKALFVDVFKLSNITRKGIMLFVPVIIVTSFINAVLCMAFAGLFTGYYHYFPLVYRWMMGDLFGMFVFGNALLLSMYFDKTPTFRRTIEGFITLLLYIVFGVLLVNGTFGNFQYDNYSYLFMIVFFASAFYFSYRLIIFLSIIYLFLLYGIDFNNLSGSVLSNSDHFSNVYLAVLANLALVTRMVIYNYHSQNNELIDSNSQLERLIDSTNLLFQLNESSNYNVDSNITYLKNIFQIAQTLFDNFECASCYINIDDKPYFIDAVGYSVDILNEIVFKDEFDWAVGKPNHVIIDESGIENIEKAELQKFYKELPQLKESIRFGLLINDEYKGGMSFDIKRDSSNNFNANDSEQFASFHRLMNNLYQVSYNSQKKNNFKNDIVLSLISTLELFDQYTHGHSEQVAEISMVLADKMHLSKLDKNELYWAAVVHDIGKVGIASSIINKTGKLTQDEYTKIKKHSENGANILSASKDLKDIAVIVKHHHEWWNGNGYPSGLRGNDIPLSSQILTIADSVSAMSDERPYSKAKSTDEIIDEIAKNSGIMFSPDIAVIMIECLNEGLLNK